jgi:signal transduction histidine kinase
LSASLAVVTYVLADRYLLAQRERTATRQAYLNARLLRSELEVAGADPPTALADLEVPAGSSVVVNREGAWYGSSVSIGRGEIPRALRRMVADDTPVRQRVEVDDTPVLIVGLPIPAIEVGYFEITALEELADTLGVIRRSLLGGSVAATVAAALLGVWAGRRVLRPLRDVSNVAADIAGGELAARLERSADADLDRIAGSFNRMLDALQERIEREKRFVSDVSHELRSPLTTLATANQVLETRRLDLPERSREALDLMAEEIRRFEQLVVELLELSRTEAGVEEVQLESTLIGEVVLHAAAAVNSSEPFTVNLAPDVADLRIMTDKRRLGRILANLLENARTHGHGIVEVGARHVDSHVQIYVDDAGPGVAPADRARVFERFFRGAAAGQRGEGSGAGLGLALVAEHARLLGCRVWVESVPGRAGARFVVEFPTPQP